MKYRKSGQAALEFLTTYGWAFLVILIMIGALAYFGILKPSKLLPDRCVLGTEIECIDYMVSDTSDQVTFRLRNNVGETITVTYFNASASESVDCWVGSATGDVAADAIFANWGNGAVLDVDNTILTCDNLANAGLEIGDKGKLDIIMTYFEVKSGSSYKHDVQGEVYATVR